MPSGYFTFQRLHEYFPCCLQNWEVELLKSVIRCTRCSNKATQTMSPTVHGFSDFSEILLKLSEILVYMRKVLAGHRIRTEVYG